MINTPSILKIALDLSKPMRVNPMSYTTSALIMFAAGLGVPLFAAINSQFGQFINSPIAAVAIMLCVAFSAILAIALIT